MWPMASNNWIYCYGFSATPENRWQSRRRFERERGLGPSWAIYKNKLTRINKNAIQQKLRTIKNQRRRR